MRRLMYSSVFWAVWMVSLMLPLQSQPAFSQWIPVGEGPGIDQLTQPLDKIRSTASPDGFYAAFSYPINSSEPKAIIKLWDGELWRPLKPLFFGPNKGMVEAIAWYDGELYLGGTFDSIRNVPGSHGIVRWTGTEWASAGGGMTGYSGFGAIYTLEVFAGELYAGGRFTEMGGTSASNLARWDGSSWDNVGSGTDNQIYTLHAGGGSLYVGGVFLQAGAISTSQIARWDGSQWHDMGGGVAGDFAGVGCIASFGRHILVFGSNLTGAGSGAVTITDKIARWDGSSWHNVPLPSGLIMTSTLWDMQAYEGKLWLAGAFAEPTFYYKNFLSWDSTNQVLDTIPQSTMGEANIYDLVIYKDDLFAIGDLGYERDRAQRWCSDQNCSLVRGTVYEDVNENCQFDWGVDRPLAGRKVFLGPGKRPLITNPRGVYEVVLPAAQTYTFTHSPPLYWEVICPGGPITVTPDTGEMILEQDFFTRVDPTQRDLSLDLSGSAGIPSRHGLSNRINFRNEGGVMIASASVRLIHDTIPTILDTEPAADQINGDTLIWNFTNLMPGHERLIRVFFRIIPPGPKGETSVWTASVQGSGGTDNTPENNVDTLRQVVINAYDPNDKQVIPEGMGAEGRIRPDDTVLQYLIRFQNTGTDTAGNVFLVDTLDSDLDIASLEVLGATHEFWYAIRENRVVVFYFDDIMLPDSNVNEPKSHGHISYLVKTKPGLPIGTEITNTTHIYFDYNPPVATNTTLNTISDQSDAIHRQIDQAFKIKVYPNPFRDVVFFKVESEILRPYQFDLLDLHGRVLISKRSAQMKGEWPLDALPPGLYFYRIIQDGRLQTTGKLIKTR